MTTRSSSRGTVVGLGQIKERLNSLGKTAMRLLKIQKESLKFNSGGAAANEQLPAIGSSRKMKEFCGQYPTHSPKSSLRPIRPSWKTHLHVPRLKAQTVTAPIVVIVIAASNQRAEPRRKPTA
jgi:hypothetical protein